MKPNILLITTDQQAHHMMSCAGNPWLQTPHMDRIAEQGTRFSRAYCSNPVCVPSRFSWYTGRMPSAIGLRENEKALPEAPPEIHRNGLGHLMRRAGYETYFGGKQHLPSKITADSLGFETYQDDERDLLATDTASLIRSKQASTTPWLIAANFINPHDICYQAIRAFADNDFDQQLLRNGQTELKELDEALKLPDETDEETFFSAHCPPLPDNHDVPEDEPEAVHHLVSLRGFRNKIRRQWSEREWRLHRWAYHRLTERVDGQIGTVLEALDDSGQRENTVIIFTSDHGDHSASHRLEHKTVFYEEATRVPLIIAPPGPKRPGSVNLEHLVNTGLDLMVTCLDYAGADQPEFSKGTSLRPVVKGRTSSLSSGAYAESQIGYMWATKDYKYCLYDTCGNEEVLYDLVNDPGETRNAANDPEKTGLLKTLREDLAVQRRIHSELSFI